MASKFDLRRFVSEFCHYADVVCPKRDGMGVCEFEVSFFETRGRLKFLAYDLFSRSTEANEFGCSRQSDVYSLLTRSVDDVNRYGRIADLSEDRTFVLFDDTETGLLRYSLGGA